jgi:hypothetical protein
MERPESHFIILRHDVETKYANALEFAKIQFNHDIQATYYFRFLPDHFDDCVISEIASLGHEIGYHYDDLSHCKGDYNAAIKRFEKNLSTLNKIAEVKTICMEGAPLSRFDNRDLWKKYNYRDFGIIGEPYFDLDFSQVFYLTDTGRRWDGGKYSVRDKVGNLNSKFDFQNSNLNIHSLTFHSTSDIILAAILNQLPEQIMFTFHPQRWTNKPFPWFQELVLQNVKNVVKGMIVKSCNVEM